MNALRDLAALLARLMIVPIFVVSAYDKIGGGFAGTVTLIASKGLPLPEALTVLTIAVEVIGAIAIVIGWKTRWAALALFVFTVIITLLYHGFWTSPAEQFRMQQTQFLKNLALCAGLLLLFAFGPGRYAIDRGKR